MEETNDVSERFDVERVDLAEVVEFLHSVCGRAVFGEVVGRTRVRDEIVAYLGCSLLEGESLVETMVSRGVLERHAPENGLVEWIIALP